MQLVLLLYKNYYNRESYKEDSVQDYYDKAKNSLVIYDYDFNENDGVNTTAIVGSEEYDYETSDYLLVVDNNEIRSRWYILDANRTRYGQYQLTLRRDVLADNWDTVIQSPMFIEKATVPDTSAFVYNQESVVTNKIKKKETLLKDDTGVAWIVGYLDKTYAGGTHTITIDTVPDMTIDTPIAQWEYYSYFGSDYYHHRNSTLALNLPFDVSCDNQYESNNFDEHRKMYYYGGINGFQVDPILYGEKFIYKQLSTPKQLLLPSAKTWVKGQNNILRSMRQTINNISHSTIEQAIEDYTTTTYNETSYTYVDEYIHQYNNKIIKDSNGKIYRVIAEKYEYENVYNDMNSVKGSTGIYATLQGIQNAFLLDTTEQGLYNNAFYFTKNATSVGTVREIRDRISLKLEELPSQNLTISIPAANARVHCKDAPYDIFAIPCPIEDSEGVTAPFSVYQYYNGSTSDYVSGLNRLSSMAVASELAKALGGTGGYLYDIQLLPYCPFGGYTMNFNGQILQLEAEYNSSRYTMVEDTDGENRNILIWVAATNGSKSIPFTPIQVDNVKMDNQTKLYRFSSGSYSAGFDINNAKNGGIKSINIDWTYLPYNPYIHLNPQFGNLYGNDYDDYRGLIDQADKSISYTSDAWIQYQIQNKTYQQQFDRELQNMEVNQNITRQKEAINSVTAAVAGGMAGGSKYGFEGAAVGAVTGMANQAINAYLNESSYNEKVSYATDKFNMNLENIKALPNALSKITAYTKNNKIFPVLEEYDCTEEEKIAIANKIKYEGMTVGAIGKIEDYIDNEWEYGGIVDRGFIKGVLINNTLIDDDWHIVIAISEELKKGIYTR